jgi:hypothetical protein
MVSNSVYQTVMDETVSGALNTNGSTNAGYDYSWMTEHYAVPSLQLPDLEQQIISFLSTPPPKNPPRETLWVFNYGYWDIWRLAAMPRTQAMRALAAQITSIFDQIELLYKKARSEDSIAYSDYYTSLKNSTAPPSGENTTVVLDVAPEPFRIFIPTLFDISLTPGFQTARFIPPYPHSRAEEMRNAAYLTEQWETMMNKMILSWIQTPDPTVNGTVNETTSLYEKRDSKGNTVLVPYARREVISHDVPKYILELIVDRQLRNVQIEDHNGLGTKPTTEGFQEVQKPCISWSASVATSKVVPATDIAVDQACEAPHEHLFWTEFTVSSRAIRDIGKAAAKRFKAHLKTTDQWLKKTQEKRQFVQFQG